MAHRQDTMRHQFAIAIAAFVLSGCSLLPGSAGGSGNEASADRRELPRVASSAPIATRPADNQCLRQLSNSGTQFSALPDRYFDQGCSNLGTVQMHALAGDGGQLGVSNVGPVTCPVSAAFAAWARFGVDRAARHVFGVPLASIQTMGSYSCRNVAGSITDSNRPQAALHCERAIRAVQLAAPFNLPEQFYSRWQDLEWEFNRRL